MNLSLPALRDAYLTGRLTPRDVIAEIHTRAGTCIDDNIWIYRLCEAELNPYLDHLAGVAPATLPLYGVPFAIKDNIDLAGIPTTAACPEFAYTPARSAYVVERLIAAGAIPIGKTNLDQFATGLVGTRSPYGATRNAFNPAYIAGGSSAGSAVACAKGLVSFALGTDTAGSGRVPAAFNNLIGVKPTRGLLSLTGVVPACRSLDCVSFFASSVQDAATLFELLAHYDDADPYARRQPLSPVRDGSFRFAVPRQLEFFGDTAAALFTALQRLQALKRQTDRVFETCACVLTPTAGRAYSLAEIAGEPIKLNSNLGHYTNFMNLLDYAAVAVPMGFDAAGVPLGASLFGPAFADTRLLHYAARYCGEALPLPISTEAPTLRLVVCGAHMSGLPLNAQLTSRGGHLVRTTKTAPHYRLYALPGGTPPRPGLVCNPHEGAAIDVEEWALPRTQMGDFMAAIPAPLAIGRIELADGTRPQGFLCEAYAVDGAQEITHWGGWRRYLERAP